jgi:hypothetical protein
MLDCRYKMVVFFLPLFTCLFVAASAKAQRNAYVDSIDAIVNYNVKNIAKIVDTVVIQNWYNDTPDKLASQADTFRLKVVYDKFKRIVEVRREIPGEGVRDCFYFNNKKLLMIGSNNKYGERQAEYFEQGYRPNLHSFFDHPVISPVFYIGAGEKIPPLSLEPFKCIK